MINSILIVCIGNICRSPMASALLASRIKGKEISSAGLGALVGHPADKNAVSLMGDRGLDIASHRGRQLTNEICSESDLILVMDQVQKKEVEYRFPTMRGRTFLLAGDEGYDIFDPYQMEYSSFERCLSLIEKGVHHWSEKIERFA